MCQIYFDRVNEKFLTNLSKLGFMEQQFQAMLGEAIQKFHDCSEP